MPEYLSIVHWEEFQHYKKRRPPWIKLHVRLLDKWEWMEELTDKEVRLLVNLWMLASRNENGIRNDIKWIERETGVKSAKKALAGLIEKGWITLAPCKQDASKALA